jgi:benzoate membrane transport protein
VLAILSTPLTTLVSAAPPQAVGTVAGVALLGTLAASLHGALSGGEPSGTPRREPAAVTFVVAASGTVFLGIGCAFWALAAGLAVRALLAVPRDLSGGQRSPAN